MTMTKPLYKRTSFVAFLTGLLLTIGGFIILVDTIFMPLSGTFSEGLGIGFVGSYPFGLGLGFVISGAIIRQFEKRLDAKTKS